ncbi:MAG: ATP-binding cassette domain-containing protein [Gammaproteobacteria bacterium]
MIHFRQVTLRRGTRVLFEEAAFSLFRGDRVGIVGANGAGKSSLFGLVTGELHADTGEVERPASQVLASVAQEVPPDSRPALEFVLDGDVPMRRAEAEVMAAEASGDGARIGLAHAAFEAVGGWSARSRAATLMAGLGFSTADGHRPVDAFSGGWRVRLALAQALMCPSDILLLDEPTNHLDLDAVLWLESWLLAYPGTLLVIAHDREFLDRIATRILSLEHGRVTAYSGNYSAFEEQRAAQLAQQQALYERQQRQVKHLESFINRFKAQATKARQAQSRVKMLERMQRIAPAHVDSEFTFGFREPAKLPRPLLVLEKADAGYAERVVVGGVGMSLAPGDRVGLLGRNGAGKSTLTRALAGAQPLLAGRRALAQDTVVGYFAQHTLEMLDGAQSPLWHIKRRGGQALAADTDEAQRTFLGTFGFRGDRVFEAVEPFSGGEKARLALALLVSHRPNLLLLDEPTNHLDLEMRHALAMALQDFAGALVVVSHDRHLLRLVTDQLWLVDDGRAAPFDGDLDDYASWLGSRREPAAATARTPAATASAATPPAGSGETAEQRQARKRAEAERRQALAPLRQAVGRAEREMEDAAAAAGRIEASLAEENLYEPARKADLTRLLAEQAAVRQRLARAEEAWLEASEQLESAAAQAGSPA